MDSTVSVPASEGEACPGCPSQTWQDAVTELQGAVAKLDGEVQDLQEEVQDLQEEVAVGPRPDWTHLVLTTAMYLSLGLSFAFLAREVAKHREALIHLRGVVEGLGARR